MPISYNGRCFEWREAALADVDAMLAIEQSVNTVGWSRIDFTSSINSSHHCQVLVFESLIVAYVITSTAADEAELLNIVVSPKFQRQGLASYLLDLSCNSFAEGIHTLFLEVRESNRAALALYEQLGFNEVGVRPNYYPVVANKNRREDAIIMAKML